MMIETNRVKRDDGYGATLKTTILSNNNLLIKCPFEEFFFLMCIVSYIAFLCVLAYECSVHPNMD